MPTTPALTRSTPPPPRRVSWWADPEIQRSRERFRETLEAQVPRMVAESAGHPPLPPRDGRNTQP
jgi:hypothetical protein